MPGAGNESSQLTILTMVGIGKFDRRVYYEGRRTAQGFSVKNSGRCTPSL
jgi:hypothetical protein